MSGIIGNADDFYRVRLMRVDEADVPDLDWREDILYRRPPSDEPGEYDLWRVEAVDEVEHVTVMSTFDDVEEAREWLATVEEDLSAMTRSEFEQAYFPGDEDGPGGSEG
ncbi:MAG TPA: hypothetical protein VGK50_09890 [Coriobacteriia bacterium]|jgi:PHP family Zn ribbon phosphoesterase